MGKAPINPVVSQESSSKKFKQKNEIDKKKKKKKIPQDPGIELEERQNSSWHCIRIL